MTIGHQSVCCPPDIIISPYLDGTVTIQKISLITDVKKNLVNSAYQWSHEL